MVTCVKFSPSGRTLATVDEDDSRVRVWDLASGTLRFETDRIAGDKSEGKGYFRAGLSQRQLRQGFCLAEGMGFEPTTPCGAPDFEKLSLGGNPWKHGVSVSTYRTKYHVFHPIPDLIPDPTCLLPS